jgi:hypothetical protein
MDKIFRFSSVATFVVLLHVGTAASMEFTVSGDVITATGPLNTGDTRRFFDGEGSAIVSELGGSQYVMHFNSVGGSLLEGVALGRELQARAIVSHVAEDSRCFSACAFAFLGGTFQYVVARSPLREIEWGGQLGFHGFSLQEDDVASVNEVFSEARALNAILAEYSQTMRGADFSWIASALTVAPDAMVYASSPRDFEALSVTVLGGPSSPPSDWDYNLCGTLIAEKLPYDSVEEVVWRLGGYATLYSVNEIVTHIVEPVLDVFDLTSEEISGESMLDLLIGGGFRLDYFRPILDARIRWLDRGAGFYFDNCIAFRSSDRAFAALIDNLNGRIVHTITSRRSPNPEENSLLTLFPWHDPLW